MNILCLISFLRKMIHSFLINKIASCWGASQDNDTKFRFAIHPQGIRQLHDNCFLHVLSLAYL